MSAASSGEAARSRGFEPVGRSSLSVGFTMSWSCCSGRRRVVASGGAGAGGRPADHDCAGGMVTAVGAGAGSGTGRTGARL